MTYFMGLKDCINVSRLGQMAYLSKIGPKRPLKDFTSKTIYGRMNYGWVWQLNRITNEGDKMVSTPKDKGKLYYLIGSNFSTLPIAAGLPACLWGGGVGKFEPIFFI